MPVTCQCRAVALPLPVGGVLHLDSNLDLHMMELTSKWVPES